MKSYFLGCGFVCRFYIFFYRFIGEDGVRVVRFSVVFEDIVSIFFFLGVCIVGIVFYLIFGKDMGFCM